MVVSWFGSPSCCEKKYFSCYKKGGCGGSSSDESNCCVTLQNQINTLRADVDRLLSVVFSLNTKMEANVVIDVAIKQDYVAYIMTYGVPEDGIFKPELLAAL